MERAAHQTLCLSFTPESVSEWHSDAISLFRLFSHYIRHPSEQDASKEEEHAFTCREQHQEATQGYWYENEDH